VDIKWPNDLLAGGKKVCGILAEVQAEVDRIMNMIIGIGVNVNHEEFPADIAGSATSLRIATGRTQARLELLTDFFEEFEKLYTSFENTGPGSIIEQWTRLSSFGQGRKIEINDGVRVISGTTRGLNALGALRVEQSDGRIEEVYSGDVVHWE